MFVHRLAKLNISIAALAVLLLTSSFPARAQTQRSPSGVVREFYKAMREHRFKDAWAMTIYKPAVEDLSAEELEDLRADFEQKAAQVPAEIEVTGEQIQGNTATVFVRVPVTESTPQVTSEPVNLISSGGVWIIGDEANQAIVKKGGRRFFLDALIEQHQSDVEDLLKRLIAVQIVYAAQHNGALGDLQALIAADLIVRESADPKAIGYHFHIAIAPDGKSYVASAEPARYGHTGKLSFWMDQTGAIKSADNNGKPVQPK
ncbi:MAG: hypothetical protein ABR607_00110 [Pyrinomonadaceae bacterium]